MRVVTLKEITKDMILAKDIYYNNSLLLRAGCNDLSRFVNKLEQLNIHRLYVEDEVSEDIVIDEMIKDKIKTDCRDILEKSAKLVAANKLISTKEIEKILNDIINEIMKNKSIVSNLLDMRAFDNFTYSHSVNVTIISIIIGKLLKYNQDKLMDLGIGAFLHDIGEITIPGQTLNKQGPLTENEYELIKQHPLLGYEMIKSIHDIKAMSRVAILQHHERIDGLGYPKGIKGSEIHDYAKIVHLADVFDALTNDRPYREKWTVYQTVEYLSCDANRQFDEKIVETFINNITVFPNGTTVVLNTGDTGVVKEQSESFLTRPVIRLIKDKDGHKIHREVKLEQELSLFIVESL